MEASPSDVYQQGAGAHLGPRAPEQTPLLTSVGASIFVVGGPVALALLFFVGTGRYPSPLPSIVVVSLFTVVAVVAGSWLWERNHPASIFSFGDLMLWNWVRRHRAERRLVRNTQLLGFDRTGGYRGDPVADEKDRLELLAEIADALDAKSSYTVNHTDRVERLAHDMGQALGLGPEDLKKLSTAAFLHDVGNIRIPEHILRKPEALTEEDRRTVESHALLGAMMAYEVVTRDVADGILHHHERWDGRGYPNGLSGEAIPLFARVIAVAESYDAMTSTRPHRSTLAPAAALRALKNEAGSQFDPLVVQALELVIPRPFGLVERLPVLAALRPTVREWALQMRRVGKVALTSAVATGTIALILGGSGTAS